MSKHNFNKKSKGKLLTTQKNSNPFESVIHAIDEKNNSTTYRHRLVFSSLQNGTVTGVSLMLALNSVSSALDWSSFALLYDEFRVLGLRIRWKPTNQYIVASSHAIYICYDNDQTSITPASNAVVLSYTNSKVFSSNQSWTYDGIFATSPNSPEIWRDTTTPSAQLGVIAIFTTVSFGATIAIAELEYEFIVEFRGRR